MLVGYARVSSTDQDLSVQLSQLKSYGCEKVFSEKASGKDVGSRPELGKLLQFVRDGDTVIVTKTDRIARNTRDALQIADELADKAVGFRLLDLGDVDINSDTGRFIYTIMSTFAEMERKRIRQRQSEGIAQAKKEGRPMGRPKVLTPTVLTRIGELSKTHNISQIAKIMGLSRTTVRRGLQATS